MAKKLSTQEILARLRAEAKGGGDEDAPAETPAESSDSEAAAETAAPESSAEESPAAPAAPTSTPGSTADILAAARAQAAGGGAAKPAADAPKPAAKAGGPKGTADILAAARAQAGKAPAAGAAEAKPAAGAKSKAKSTKPLPAGDTPSVQEMLRAVRGGEQASVSTKPEKRVAVEPVIPEKPPAAAPRPAKAKGQDVARRGVVGAMLLSPFALAWILFSGATTAFLLGLARFMMPNVLVEPPTKFKVGPPSDYPLNTVSTKWKAARGIWIVSTDQYDGQSMVYALLSVCTHLGCTPSWLDGEQKFKCPCHGSGFYITGINFEGPAPRPLERVGIRVDPADGMLEVDKSVKFQQELGQWNDATSYYPLG